VDLRSFWIMNHKLLTAIILKIGHPFFGCLELYPWCTLLPTSQSIDVLLYEHSYGLYILLIVRSFIFNNVLFTLNYFGCYLLSYPCLLWHVS
jgi:hypothetical protein